MAKIQLIINGEERTVEAEPDTPLLWVLRDTLGLTGTKFGCGQSLCGACTLHVEDKPLRACVTSVGSVQGREIVTIEGLSADGSHPVQQAWVDEDVPQCGYCQAGQIMMAAWLVGSRPDPTDEEIDQAMSGNICRCGTLPRIRRAIHRAAEIARSRKS